MDDHILNDILKTRKMPPTPTALAERIIHTARNTAQQEKRRAVFGWLENIKGGVAQYSFSSSYAYACFIIVLLGFIMGFQLNQPVQGEETNMNDYIYLQDANMPGNVDAEEAYIYSGGI